MNPLTEWFKSFGNDAGYSSDAAATDAYFEAASQAPLSYVTVPTSTARTGAHARVISQVVQLTEGVARFILPADPNRLCIEVYPVQVPDPGREYRLASDKPYLNGSDAPLIGSWKNNYHTGALWAISDVDMDITVSVTTM